MKQDTSLPLLAELYGEYLSLHWRHAISRASNMNFTISPARRSFVEDLEELIVAANAGYSSVSVARTSTADRRAGSLIAAAFPRRSTLIWNEDSGLKASKSCFVGVSLAATLIFPMRSWSLSEMDMVLGTLEVTENHKGAGWQQRTIVLLSAETGLKYSAALFCG